MNRVLRKRLALAAATAGGMAALGGTVGALISCGTQSVITHYAVLPTYTGQADILLSLGIAPDYYPVQLRQSAPYPYVTSPAQYMNNQPEAFSKAFEAKMKALAANFKGTGRSWWNQDAEKAENANPDPEYWTHMDADLFMYEQYLLDDSQKAINPETAPTFKESVKTNFRSSRDPYTRLSEEQIRSHDDTNSRFWYGQNVTLKEELRDDFNFAHSFTTRALDQDTKDDYYGGLVQKQTDYVFNPLEWRDKLLAGFYNNATLSAEVKKAGLDKISYLTQIANKKIQYPPASGTTSAGGSATTTSVATVSRSLRMQSPGVFGTIPLAHHPIYESQTELGSAPAYEGAIRDNSLYLYTVAADLTALFKERASLLKDDPRRDLLLKAQENAKSIIKNLQDRQAKIKTFFTSIGVLGKTFAMVTIAPGAGQDTIQTDSKYAFLYRDIGLNYPWPKSWTEAYAAEKEKSGFSENDGKIVGQGDQTKFSLMNLDDNGWFFDVTQTKTGDAGNVGEFKGSADFGVIAARQENWTNKSLQDQGFYNDVFKSGWKSQIDSYHVDYDLWNEGIKMPAVLNMVLDQVVAAATKYAETVLGRSVDKNLQGYKDAFNWGDYWTQAFVK